MNRLTSSSTRTRPGKRLVRRGQLAGILVTAILITSSTALAAEPPAPYLHDVTTQTGLDFVHWNGRSGSFYFPEMTGYGAALFDADGDGDLDLYVVQGSLLGEGKTLDQATDPPPAGPTPPRDRLYRNDSETTDTGERLVRFTDVTEASGITATGYGMAVAVGDVDGDGRPDLYVANYGANQLWRNLGPDGNGVPRFENITQGRAVADDSWSTSATFFDADGDGNLDLYVVNYVDFDLVRNPRCYATSSRQDYCGPSAFPAQADQLLRGKGDGTFVPITSSALTDYQAGKGLGVVAVDFDGDHRLDLYVANDGEPNQLWLNRGPAATVQDDATVTFLDEALLAGVAVNRRGEPEASMGVAAADADGDGDTDLFITHLSAETNTFYVNDGTGLFDDRSIESGLGPPSMPFTGFGTGWLDLDHDGWLDLFVANGAVRILEARAQAGDDYPLDETNLLFRNLGGGRFTDVTARGGSAFTLAEVSRGAAFGDLDNDGDTDVVLLNNHGPARVLRNEHEPGDQWLGLRLTDAQGRLALGSRVVFTRTDGRTLWRRTARDGSYASSSDPRIVLPLAESPSEGAKRALRVIWPDGTEERFAVPAAGRYHELRRGTGIKSATPDGSGGGLR